MTSLMTAAPALQEPARGQPTGNLLVHLPECAADGSLWRLGAVSLRVAAVIDFHGRDAPLIVPRVSLQGQRVELSGPETHLDWIPRSRSSGVRGEAVCTVLTPVEERGAVLELSFQAQQDEQVTLEFAGTWREAETARFGANTVPCARRQSYDPWTRSAVWSLVSPELLLAVGIHAESTGNLSVTWSCQETQASDASPLSWLVSASGQVRAGERATLRVYLGVAPEGDGARTTALHLRRVGWNDLLERTGRWLSERRFGEDALSRLAQRNRFFAYFYAQADSIDTSEPVMLTSRSTRYYVSGAYWARDSLLWAFPAVLQLDARRARTMLLTALGRYARFPGEHAQYLHGPVLYPGFELDQAAAHYTALAAYLTVLPDLELWEFARSALRNVEARVREHAHASLQLYRSFLSPTDDPVPQPYLTYDNALLAAGLRDLAHAVRGLDPDESHRLGEWGRAVLRDLLEQAPREGRFSFAFDPDSAEYTFDDAPAGSLLLLAPLGIVNENNPIYQATAGWIRSPGNPHHYPGRYPGRGSAHFPNPSVFSLVNDLKSGFRDEPLRVLRSAPLDEGLACESYDPESGRARTGGAFATLAGWLGATLAELIQSGNTASVA